ncbi:TetR/AcrR family transcriptional regulator [Agromyces sp. SYSU T0242]|uniref:TetR/AcrR family transcriptional regulator n=1 Tax=Agromyces litoreus TaxID=3158561 RepID=UPI003393F095
MHQWLPISTSPKGRLALVAVAGFGGRPYGEVAVADLAADAGVTTGALYHHFGSKLGLFSFVREDVERRLLDRIEGALATSAQRRDVMGALAVGFDFAVREGVVHLLDAPPPGAGSDLLAEAIAAHLSPAPGELGVLLAAAWRAAVQAVGTGVDPARARAALLALSVDPEVLHG